jgi:hypothetical protein
MPGAGDNMTDLDLTHRIPASPVNEDEGQKFSEKPF